jgi:hypothetical protein
MQKYKIEGNIDFFSELYNSLDISENSEKTSEDDNLCLITGHPLIDYFVKLNCGHKFNYISLYNDIKNHKQKFNSMESSHLKQDEIRCPYCRNKQQELLPYYEEIGLPKIHGVNFIDPNRKKYQASLNNQYTKCEYLTPNPKYDPSGNEHIEKATEYCQLNCKFFTCLNNAYFKISDFIEGYEENKCYCYFHNKKIVKEHNLMLKNKAKEEAKQVKLKAKDEAKKAKEEAKLKEKEEKKNMKKKTKPVSENLVLGPSVIIKTHNECVEILKSGPNKGKSCGCKVYNDAYCKRHIKKEEISKQEIPEEKI